MPEEIALKEPNLDDLEFIRWLWADPDTMALVGGPVIMDDRQAKAWFSRVVSPGSPTDSYHLIIDQKGKPLGEVSFHRLEEETMAADLNIKIAAKYRGNGYARQALTLFLKYFFQELGGLLLQDKVAKGNQDGKKFLLGFGFDNLGSDSGFDLLALSLSRYYEIYQSPSDKVDFMAEDHWLDPKPEFKWPIESIQAIQAPAQEVWRVISLPNNLELCHPYCEKNPVQVWPGEGSRDEVHYLSEWIYVRRFCRWIEGIGYDLEIGREGGGQSFVSWRIKAIDDLNSTLKITVYPHALQKLQAAVRWLPHIMYLKPNLRRYLSSVTRGFEWFITRGEPVPNNHFGPHPWFSAKD